MFRNLFLFVRFMSFIRTMTWWRVFFIHYFNIRSHKKHISHCPEYIISLSVISITFVNRQFPEMSSCAKYMINRSERDLFHIISLISAWSWYQSSILPTLWLIYHDLGLIRDMIWKRPSNNLNISYSHEQMVPVKFSKSCYVYFN